MTESQGKPETSSIADPGSHWLILDDDPEDVELLQAALEQVDATRWALGLHPREYLNLPVSERPTPSLAIVDGRIAPADWRDIVSLLNLQSVPFVVVSGSHLLEDRSRALDSGAREYFPKPLDLDGYLALARSLLEIARKGCC